MAFESGVIPEFRGEYYFLSNYATTPFVWRNVKFTSGEQAFAYAKTFFARPDVSNLVEGAVTEQSFFQAEILNASTPGQAKKLGRQVQINVPEWDKRKVQYMSEIISAKFMTGENLIGPLCNTGKKMLVEGNTWGDKFWGRCKDADGTWRGLNTLGVILMEERGFWSKQQVCCVEHKVKK